MDQQALMPMANSPQKFFGQIGYGSLLAMRFVACHPKGNEEVAYSVDSCPINLISVKQEPPEGEHVQNRFAVYLIGFL